MGTPWGGHEPGFCTLWQSVTPLAPKWPMHGPGTNPKRFEMAIGFTVTNIQAQPSILDPFRAISKSQVGASLQTRESLTTIVPKQFTQ